MSRRYFTDGWKETWGDERRPRRRLRFLPMSLMCIGAVTVFVMAARYVVVPLLVYLGGLL